MLLLDARYLRQPRSGIPRYTLNLLRAIAAADPGRRVRVLTPGEDALPNDLASQGTFDAVVEHTDPRELRDQLHWPSRLRRLTPSVLHCPDVFGPLRSRTPVAITLHDLIPLVCRDGLARSRKQRWLPLWRYWLRRQARAADALITVSQHSAHDIEGLLGVPRDKLHVVYNAVPPPEERHRDATALPTGVDPTARLVLCVGRFDPYKNVPTLVEAFARLTRPADLSETEPETQLVLVGPPDPRYPQAQNIAEQLGVTSRVVFTGSIPDTQLEALYRRAALLVAPSRYEGFGLPAVEAMRHGVPVVASNAAALPEVTGDAALRVEPGDPDALAEAMRRVLNDPALASDLARGGTNNAKRFDPAVVGAAYLKLIDRLSHHQQCG